MISICVDLHIYTKSLYCNSDANYEVHAIYAYVTHTHIHSRVGIGKMKTSSSAISPIHPYIGPPHLYLRRRRRRPHHKTQFMVYLFHCYIYYE